METHTHIDNPVGRTKELKVVDLAKAREGRPCFGCIHTPVRGVYCHEPHHDCNINNDWKRYRARDDETGRRWGAKP